MTLTPGTPQQLTLSALATAPTANATVTFTGTSGSLTHNATLGLTVNGTSNGVPVRTRYVRTDATTEYYLWVNQHWILYHAATGRYFVTDPSSNEIIVLDAPSQTVIARIGVPGALGLDDTPDHSTKYVGTQVGDVYAIDPVAMAVTQRYIASQIGPYGFAASQVLVLADGELALIGLYNGVDGTTDLALWNPANNSATVYGGLGGIGLPCNVGTLGGFARTVDRTQILLGAINGGGLCEFNPTTGTTYTVSTGSDLHITTTPDGNSIIMPNGTNGVTVFNAQNLETISQIPVQGGVGPSPGFVVSADSKTLYVPQETVIYAYDLGTGQQIGWLPNMYVQFTSGGMAFGPITSPYLLAIDGSGLFAGPTEEGVGFMDPGCCYGNYELALSSNQTQFTATFCIYDSDLNNESYYALNDREVLNIAYVYGAKLSPDGLLLFQPSTNGIDVFDGHVGNLRERISLPFALSSNYDALVSDGDANVVVAIAGMSSSGVAIIDLTSLPERSASSFGLGDRSQASKRRVPNMSSVATHHDARSRGVRSIPHVTRDRLSSRVVHSP